MIHLKKEAYSVSRWAGGETTQIYIAPAGASYGDRDFLWRVSSATVELEESDFTVLADYDRWITTLAGNITLTHNGGTPVKLAPFEVHRFDGGADTHCLGRCTDFNLMLRKGMCQGALRTLCLPAGTAQEVGFADTPAFPSASLVVYCASGQCLLDGQSLAAGDSVVTGTAISIKAQSTAQLIIAEIQYQPPCH